jgi:hypothetical protein
VLSVGYPNRPVPDDTVETVLYLGSDLRKNGCCPSDVRATRFGWNPPRVAAVGGSAADPKPTFVNRGLLVAHKTSRDAEIGLEALR